MRVVTFNLHFANRPERALEVIHSEPALARAEVIFLQEADDRAVAILGEALGMVSAWWERCSSAPDSAGSRATWARPTTSGHSITSSYAGSLSRARGPARFERRSPPATIERSGPISSRPERPAQAVPHPAGPGPEPDLEVLF